MIRRMMGGPSRLLPLIFALTAWPAAAQAQPGPVTLAANPSRICLGPGAGAYPNFDLIVRDSSNTELTVGEVRGIVLGADGEMIERRLIWQGATALLAPDNRVAAGGGCAVAGGPSASAAAIARIKVFMNAPRYNRPIVPDRAPVATGPQAYAWSS